MAALASQTVSTPAPTAGTTSVDRRPSGGTLILAAAVPLVFLHARYQPTLSIGLRSTSIDVTLADAAIASVAAAAAVRLAREGLGSLRASAWPLAAAGAFLAIIVLQSFAPIARGDDYALAAHLVSAAKFGWYALLAPATIVLVASRRDGVLLLRSLVAWSLVASAWGALQFVGLVSEFEGKRPGQREPSFLGVHDFAALSGAALAVGLVGLTLRRAPLGGPWSAAALAGGSLGLVLSGAMSGVIGLWLAGAAILAVSLRDRSLRLRDAAAVAGVVLAVAAGTAAMRATALERFAEFIGLRDRAAQSTGVESYAHRTLLGYIGVRIFLDHPILGVGWQASSDDFAYTPYLSSAHRRFPDVPAEAFPSPQHRWGVQNAYLQTLADLGLVGFAALAAAFATALVKGLRRSRATPLALVGVAWLLVAAGVWGGLGLVPGIPLAALTWMAFGLACVRE